MLWWQATLVGNTATLEGLASQMSCTNLVGSSDTIDVSEIRLVGLKQFHRGLDLAQSLPVLYNQTSLSSLLSFTTEQWAITGL